MDSSRLQTRPLRDDFGLEVRGIDLARNGADVAFPVIRDLFETHSLLLFRDQDFDEAAHRRLAERLGPMENLSGAPS